MDGMGWERQCVNRNVLDQPNVRRQDQKLAFGMAVERLSSSESAPKNLGPGISFLDRNISSVGLHI